MLLLALLAACAHGQLRFFIDANERRPCYQTNTAAQFSACNATSDFGALKCGFSGSGSKPSTVVRLPAFSVFNNRSTNYNLGSRATGQFSAAAWKSDSCRADQEPALEWAAQRITVWMIDANDTVVVANRTLRVCMLDERNYTACNVSQGVSAHRTASLQVVVDSSSSDALACAWIALDNGDAANSALVTRIRNREPGFRLRAVLHDDAYSGGFGGGELFAELNYGTEAISACSGEALAVAATTIGLSFCCCACICCCVLLSKARSSYRSSRGTQPPSPRRERRAAQQPPRARRSPQKPADAVPPRGANRNEPRADANAPQSVGLNAAKIRRMFERV